jgi:hypothetical protein
MPWFSWGALTVVSTFVALSALWVALTPAGDQTELAAVAARMLVDQYPAGYYYTGITTVAAAALLIPIRNVLRPRERGL